MNVRLQREQAAPTRPGGAVRPPAHVDPPSALLKSRDVAITPPLSSRTLRLCRVGIVAIAPAVALVAHTYHPRIGSPSDPDFFDRLAAAVAADPTRWGVAHLGVAVSSGLLVLAFLAIRSFLRDAGEERWSTLGLPFIVMGSLLYALLPALEIALLGVYGAGGDVAAVQAALMPWFVPILLGAAVLFAVGVFGFVIALARSAMLGSRLTWLVLAALAVTAGARFFPVGMAQLHVGPAAGLLALWPLAYAMWKRPRAAPRR